MIGNIVWPQIIAFFAVLVYGSFFEWTLHRFVMHKQVKFLSYPYKLHAITHHGLFKADETYHAQNKEMKSHVTFTPRDYLFLLCINIAIFFLFETLTGFPLMLTGSIAVLCYLAAFDLLHWCFHVPKGRFFEKFRLYRWIKRHHLLHHRHQNRNLNVVLPIADFFFFTLIRKPRGDASVMDV